MVKDLKSREFWIFNNQDTFAFDFDIATDDAPMRGTEIKTGDKIQVTCVYYSTDPTDPTFFALSTYDEMCMTNAVVTFEAPPLCTFEDIGHSSSITNCMFTRDWVRMVDNGTTSW